MSTEKNATPSPSLPLGASFEAKSVEDWRALVSPTLKGGTIETRLTHRGIDGLVTAPLYTPGGQQPQLAPGEAPYSRGYATSATALRVVQGTTQAGVSAAATELAEDLARGVEAVEMRLAQGRRLGGAGQALAVTGLDVDGAAATAVLADVPRAVPVYVDAGVQTEQAWAALKGSGRTLYLLCDPFALAAEGACADEGLDALLAGMVARAESLVDLGDAGTGDAGTMGRGLGVDLIAYHNAGAGPALEVGVAAAAVVALAEAVPKDSPLRARFADALWLRVPVDAEQFPSIAKLRALRMVLHGVLSALGLAETGTPHILAVTSDRMRSARDPWVNMLRDTVATFAAGVGGADALLVRPFDAALGTPGRLARRMARNTSIILQEESHIRRVTDPAGGSWFVEQLTRDIAESAWTEFQRVQGFGGLSAALQTSALQKVFAELLDARQAAVAKRKLPVTGVSEFPWIDEVLPEVEALSPVDAQAEGAPLISEPLRMLRDASAFEALRDRADAAAAKGHMPKVALLNLGPVAQHTARSTWAKNFFETAGLRTEASAPLDDAAAAVAAFQASGAGAVCLCSSDEVYGELAAACATALKDAGAVRVYLAGRPGEAESAYRTAGVHGFIYVGCDVLALLDAELSAQVSSAQA